MRKEQVEHLTYRQRMTPLISMGKLLESLTLRNGFAACNLLQQNHKGRLFTSALPWINSSRLELLSCDRLACFSRKVWVVLVHPKLVSRSASITVCVFRISDQAVIVLIIIYIGVLEPHKSGFHWEKEITRLQDIHKGNLGKLQILRLFCRFIL